MPVIIIFIAAAVAIIASVIICNLRRKKIKQPESAQFISCDFDFSASDYLKRIDKYYIEIMQKQEESPKDTIILWVGLNGLRLNDDGTTEWIRREEEKPKPIGDSYTPCQSLAWNTMQHPFIGCQNITSQVDNNIRILQMQLDMQMQNLRTQQAQMLQSQQMNAIIHSPYIPACSPYYQSAVTQCCVKPIQKEVIPCLPTPAFPAGSYTLTPGTCNLTVTRTTPLLRKNTPPC